MKTEKILDRALEILEKAANSTKNEKALRRIEEVTLWDKGYVEPGYPPYPPDTEHKIIATGDWNSISHYDKTTGHRVEDDVTLPRISELFDSLGIPCEWDDEWCACSQCARLFRTQPDCYGWKKSYYDFDGDLVCNECVDPELMLKDLEGKPHVALTMDTIDPMDYGYTEVNEESYTNGWYGGQNDSPDAIAEAIEEMNISRYLFKLGGVGQFDVTFSVFVHDSEVHRLVGTPVGKCFEDPADVLSRGLKNAALQSRKSGTDGIEYTKINSDGTATTRTVSPEEFVDGIQ